MLALTAAFPVLAVSSVAQALQADASSRSTELLAQDNSVEFEYEDFDFWAEQCLLLRDEQKYTETLTACEKAISLEPKEDNVELWVARGAALFHLNQYSESLVSYNRAVEASPNYSLAIAYQCANFYQLQRYDDAIYTCEQALRIDGNWGNGSPILAWYYRGLALKQLGRLETALSSFDRALLIDPEDPQAIAERCATLSELGSEEFDSDCGIQETATSYERALVGDSGDIDLWMQQGLALEQLGAEPGSYQRALTSYNRAIEINPQNSVALARRCGVLNALETYEAALESCEQAFQGDGKWGTGELVYAWNQHSVALAGLGRYEEALASAERAIDIDVRYAPAWNSRAVSLWRMNQTDPDALRAIDQAIDLYTEAEPLLEDTFERTYPDPPVLFYRGQILAWFNRGRILSSMSDYAGAVQAYEQALTIHKTDKVNQTNPLSRATLADIWVNLSAASLHTDPNQSLSASQQAIQLRRDSLAGWYNQGLALTRLGQPEAALAAFQEAERLDPNNVHVLIAQGIALENSGDQQAAIEMFNYVLNLDPNQTIAQQHLDNIMNSIEQP